LGELMREEVLEGVVHGGNQLFFNSDAASIS
jgi:hypothetical protein